jgi:hypothetical protein
MLSSKEIENAKKRTSYGIEKVHHEHDDCIRIAYEWLDGQTTTKGIMRRARPLKHDIEKWGGRYVSQSDVEVAAELHPKIRGHYPYFNISARLVRPSDARLAGLASPPVYSSFGPSFTVSFPILPVKRKGTW